MTSPMFDVHELIQLEADLGKVSGVAVKSITVATVQNAESLRAAWASGIASTGGSHLPHLPAAVTVEMKFGLGVIGAQVGPDRAKRQGAFGKGDEYGSVNTPAHMHGHKSADVVEPLFNKAVEAAALAALGGL